MWPMFLLHQKPSNLQGHAFQAASGRIGRWREVWHLPHRIDWVGGEPSSWQVALADAERDHICWNQASMHTRSLKGYLWTKELCEKKGCGELFKSRSKCLTSVQHMGKTVTGILRDVNCLGAIEIYEDSSVSAIRSNVAGEADAMDCDAVSEQNQLFTNLIQQIKSQETEDGDGNSGLKAAARKDDDFLDLWGVSSSVGGPSSSNRNRGSEGTCAEASRPPKKQKITKKLAAGVVGQPSTSDSVPLQKYYVLRTTGSAVKQCFD